MIDLAEPSRRADYRVAIPLQQPIPAPPTLIPADVWSSYQQEMALSELEESKRHLIETAAAPIEIPQELGADDFVSAEYAMGLVATVPADPELAQLTLGQVPLFSDLSSQSLNGMVRQARQGEVGPREYLFREGEPADSFFVVVEGTVEILRRREECEVVLRHLGPGEAIGLFGLFSGQVRAACARAIGEALVLEIPCEALSQLVQADQALNERMLKFYRERLLEGFLGASKLFTDIDPVGRARLLGRFQERTLSAQENLVQPGEVCNLIGVLISGRLHLEHRPKVGQPPRCYELLPGQFVAVTSALSGSPSRMRVYSTEQSHLALLGHREITELLRDYPALRGITTKLSASARALERDVHCGHTGVPGL